MSKVDRNALRAFLKLSGAPDDLADRAMVAAETLIAKADTRDYALYDGDSSAPPQCAAFESLPLVDTIHRVTGRPIGHVLRMSREYPIARQPWMTAEAYERHRQFKLEGAAQEILEESVEPSFEGAMWTPQGDALERALDAVASERKLSLRWGTIDVTAGQATGLPKPPGFSWRAICLDKLDEFLGLVHDAAEERLGYDDARRVTTVLGYLFAFAIVGDEERVALFAQLTEILAWVIPIGWKKDEPDVFLIRVA